MKDKSVQCTVHACMHKDLPISIDEQKNKTELQQPNR